MLGIEALSRGPSRSPSKTRARLAAVCSLFPGGGAVYNRQNVKAIVYFIAIIGLFQLTALHVLGGLFALAGMAFYLYSVVDSYRTAELIAAGESPARNEDRFKRSLVKRAPVLGLLLAGCGLLLLLQIARPFGFEISLVRLAPVALIIVGGYLIVSYIRRRREEAYRVDYSPGRYYISLSQDEEGVYAQRGESRGRR